MIEVFISKTPYHVGNSIWITKKEGGKFYIAKPMELEFKEVVGSGLEEKPSLTLRHIDGNEILKAFAEALDKEGIKTENDNKILGLLEATKYHLEDMRKLTFSKIK